MLRCLHSHLGSGAARQASAALDALLQLLEADATALLSYAAFLTGMLGNLQHFSPDQVHQASSTWRMWPERTPHIAVFAGPLTGTLSSQASHITCNMRWV